MFLLRRAFTRTRKGCCGPRRLGAGAGTGGRCRGRCGRNSQTAVPVSNKVRAKSASKDLAPSMESMAVAPVARRSIPVRARPMSGGRVGTLRYLQPVQSPRTGRRRCRVWHGYRRRLYGCGNTFHRTLRSRPDRAAPTGRKGQRPGIAAKPAGYVRNLARPKQSFLCQPVTGWPLALRDMSSAVPARPF
jgi:hypothetical protein